MKPSKLLVASLLLLASTAAMAEGDAAKGKSIYTANCMACHGVAGDGNGPAAVALNPKPKSFADPAFWAGRTDEALTTTIRAGKPGTAMAPFPQLKDEDIANLTAYLRSFVPAQ